MSERENVRKLEGKERSVDFVKKVSSAKLETIKSETCIRPRFANHTLSSLMKRRTPINSRKKSSTMSTRASKKSQKSLVYNRPSGIYKRHSITKQNKSMQALMTILKWEKADYRASVSRQDSELTGTVCECTENTLVFLSSDLIKDVSRNLKKFAASPAKSVISRGEPTKVVNQPEKRVEDSHAHLEEKMKRTDLSPCLQDNTEENIRDNMKENCTTIDIARQSQPSDVEKKLANSHREIKVLHRRPKPNKPEERLAEDFSNKDCSAIETQIYRQNGPANVNDATTDNRKYAFRRGNRKTWAIRKAEIKHVNDERTYNVNLQSSRNSKFVRHVNNSRDKDDRSVVNCAVSIQNKGTFQKNLVFHNNQRVWRPPGVTRPSVIKSTMSLTQPTSQKSSKSTKRAIASMKNKYSSIEHTEMLNSEPTNASTSVNQSKMVMKENRDPRANRITKICEHFAEAKQQQRLQSGGTLSKKRHPTKGDSNTSNNHNNANPTISRPTSRSRHWQTIKPREYSRNWNEQNRTESAVIYNKRSKPSEVIHTLKEIINGVKIDEDVEKNAVNMSNYDVFNNKESDSGLQALSNRDISAKMSQNDKTNFIKNKHFDEPNRSFNQSVQKSISTQKEERPDSTESLKLTQIATQSSSYNNNIVKVGCNTTHYNIICRDAEVSCALISSTNSKADIDSTAIGDKTMTLEDVPVHAESIMHAESNAEDEYFDKSKKLPISECKRTLSTEMTLELEDYDIMDTPAKASNNFIRDDEKIIDGNSQAFLKLLESFDDKTMTLEDVPVHAKSIMHAESNAEDEYFDKSKKLPISECKRTLSTEMTLELEDYDIMDTPAKPTSNFIRDKEKIIENSQTLLKLLENFDDKPNIVINRPQTFDRDNVNYIWQYLFTERYPLPSSSIYNYNYPWTDEEIAKCYGIESEHEDMSSCSSEEVMSELNVKNIPSDVTAASELAGECASFYKAGELYKFINYENLSFPKPEEIKNRDEETIEDYEIVEKGGSCVNCEIVNRSRSKCDAKCCCFVMANAEDNDGFSTCSSKSSNSVQMCECDISLYKLPISKYYQLVKQKKIKSLSELMVQGMIEKEYKFKVLQLVDDMKEYKGLQLIEDENNDETAGAVKTLALPTTAEKTFSIISLENLLSLIYFILSFIVFWYLEVWFQFDPAT